MICLAKSFNVVYSAWLSQNAAVILELQAQIVFGIYVLYELFYADGSASMGIQVILEELAVPYRLIESTIDMNEERPEKQLLINPNGWVPVLSLIHI